MLTSFDSATTAATSHAACVVSLAQWDKHRCAAGRDGVRCLLLTLSVSHSLLYLCSDPAFVAALLRLLGQNGKLILEEGLAAVRGRWLTRLA